jgi:dethiobiotin synthetase/adenosylmethionine--8-amino-7-oxononanoate aminotransferase
LYLGASDLSSTTLYKWKDAVSPHVAANLDTCQSAPTDNELIEKLLMKINAFICENRSELGNSDESMKANIFTVLETAGGVLSPSPSRTLQADLYRILRLPIILVGDGRLGSCY